MPEALSTPSVPQPVEGSAGAPPPLVVAAFDFDGTLTWRDTLLPFLRHLLGLPTLLWMLLACSPWLLGYALRLTSNHRAKGALLHACLSGQAEDAVKAKAETYLHRAMPDQWRPWALEQLRSHQRQGHCCVIVSASPSFYMHLVGKLLHVDAVLCTEMEISNGRYTGRMVTANCHGAEKVRRLQTWFKERFGANTVATLYAYGDTRGDHPMLSLAQHAWYRQRPWPRVRR
jgi:phosphatidylglycerophosphatase C